MDFLNDSSLSYEKSFFIMCAGCAKILEIVGSLKLYL